jgi:3-oxoacyl-[acyl-carrier-protein] synthase II
VKKIVVTGYGIKAPGIEDSQRFKDVLDQGLCTLEVVSGIGPNESDLVCGIIHNEYKRINGRNYRYYPRIARMAIAAADDAVRMSGIEIKEGLRVSVILGTSVGGLSEIEQYAVYSNNGQYEKFPLIGAGAGNPHSLSSSVAYHIGANGLVFTLSTGCTAGLDSIMMAKVLLESGQSDVCIVGGSDAPISTGCIYSFAKMGALSKDLDIHTAGSPFSMDKEGFVLSEGAAVLVLERELDALARDTAIYGSIDNIYSNNDGQSIFASDLTGETMSKALKMTVGDHLPTYINSQALGLQANDTVEYIAYTNNFEGHSIPITSIKGQIGHAFGASGVMQTVASLISIEYDFIPPTVKTTGYGFGDLPILQETKYCDVNQVVVTSHGYGGNNTCMLLSKYLQ